MRHRPSLFNICLLAGCIALAGNLYRAAPLYASSTGADASYQCGFKLGDSFSMKFSVGSSKDGRASVRGTLTGKKLGIGQLGGSYQVSGGSLAGRVTKIVNRKKKKIALLSGIFNENDQSLLMFVTIGSKEKQVTCKPKGSSTPGASPTPTPTLQSGNFDSAGNVTAAGKALFGIPSNLSANKNTGQTLYTATCKGCHTSEKTNRSFSFLKTATAGSPMFLSLDDGELADLTAYLNRFRN